MSFFIFCISGAILVKTEEGGAPAAGVFLGFEERDSRFGFFPTTKEQGYSFKASEPPLRMTHHPGLPRTGLPRLWDVQG